MLMFFVYEQYSSEYYVPPGLYYFLQQADNSASVYLIMMITAFPAAMLFYDDWTSGNFKFIISRVGRKKYAIAVTLAEGITAAAVMILSYVIFSGVVLLKFPAVPDMDTETLRAYSLGFPNSGLLYTGNAFWCYLLYFLTRGAMSAFFAVIAIFQSMLITNKHLTIISPVLVYILYFSFNLYYIFPALINPFVLYRNGYKLYLEFGGTPEGSLFSPAAGLYPLIFTIIIVAVLSIAEAIILRKKMNKDI